MNIWTLCQEIMFIMLLLLSYFTAHFIIIIIIIFLLIPFSFSFFFSPDSVPIISSVLSIIVTAAFAMTTLASGLLTVSTASLQTLGMLSRSSTLLSSDPSRNLFVWYLTLFFLLVYGFVTLGVVTAYMLQLTILVMKLKI